MLVHKFAKLTVFCAFFLIMAGALVTSTGSGLSVPDWPLSFGQYFPTMRGGVRFEHSHRMIAGMVGLLTLTLTILVWTKETRRWVRWLSAGALFTVFIQALLGGITVLYGLPPSISIFHAVLAQIFFCLMVGIATFTSPSWPAARGEKPLEKHLFYISLITTTAIFVQLVLGASFRHGIGIQFLKLHILNAVIVSSSSLVLWFKTLKSSKEIRSIYYSSLALILLLMVQNLLGLTAWIPMISEIFSRLWNFRAIIVTVHVATGALILATSLRITLRTVQPQ